MTAVQVGGLLGPAGGLLRVITPGTQALTVVEAGRAALGVRGDVVGVPDRRVTPDSGTDALFSGPQEAGESLGVEPGRRGRGQQPPVRVDVDRPQPGRVGLDRVRGEVAGHRGRDNARTGWGTLDHHSGLVACGQEGVVRDQEVDRDRHIRRVTGFASGGVFDEGVGHDLTHPTPVPGRLRGIGGCLELGVGLHTLRHRHQRGQVDHQVRGRTDRDPAFRHGLGVAVHARVHIQPGGEFLDPGDQPSGAHAGEFGQVGGSADLLIDQGPVLHGQVGRLPHQEGGPPLGQDPGLQGGEGVGHLGDPDPGGGHESGPRVRADP